MERRLENTGNTVSIGIKLEYWDTALEYYERLENTHNSKNSGIQSEYYGRLENIDNSLSIVIKVKF